MTKDRKQDEAARADDLLIREVDDDLRAERIHNLWNKFGSLLIGACVTVVLATIAYQMANSYRNSSAEENTAILLEAQSFADKGQIETAVKKLEPLMDKKDGSAYIAKLQNAALSKNTKYYSELSKQNDYPAIRDVAHIESGQTSSVKADSAFYSIAAEQKAVALIENNKTNEARLLLLKLLDNKAIPNSQRARLNELLQGVN